MDLPWRPYSKKFNQSYMPTTKERWQPASTSSKRHISSEFRKCENATCSAAAINRTCTHHPDRLMMECSSTCHKKAKKQRRECSKSSLATSQPQTDTDMANAEIAALTESKDFPLPAPTQLLHKRAMPDGSQTGIDDSLPAIKSSPTSSNIERPKAHRKLDFRPPLSYGNDVLSNITSDQVDTSPLSI